LFYYVPHRNEDTIASNGEVEKVINDIEIFKTKQNWYTENGIAYKRGYLLFGEPGSGKTSLVHIVASKYNLPIYLINIDTTMTDTSIIEILSTITNNSIILFEDFDRFLTKDSSNSIAPILSSIDGVISKHNVLIFITCNDILKIDSALFRPGRIDLKIEYKKATKIQIQKLFYMFYSTEDECTEFLKLINDYEHAKYA